MNPLEGHLPLIGGETEPQNEEITLVKVAEHLSHRARTCDSPSIHLCLLSRHTMLVPSLILPAPMAQAILTCLPFPEGKFALDPLEPPPHGAGGRNPVYMYILSASVQPPPPRFHRTGPGRRQAMPKRA